MSWCQRDHRGLLYAAVICTGRAMAVLLGTVKEEWSSERMNELMNELLKEPLNETVSL